MKNKLKELIRCLLLCGILCGCSGGSGEQEPETVVISPVSIESAVPGPISESIELTAITVYLQKEIIRSPATGYIEKMEKQVGQTVSAGETVLTIRTREASILRTHSADSNLSFTGLINIPGSSPGVVSQVDHQQGDYVVESDPLAVISKPESLIFLLKVPYIYRQYISVGKEYMINLPDNTHIRGIIVRSIPSVDPSSQTQDFILKPTSGQTFPENLSVTVTIVLQTRNRNNILHKSSILTNETQTEFWVMKLESDSVAIKVPILKGIETDSLVEVISPAFDATARFISYGNYGLPDTARIRIVEPGE